ncbi:hypothetical protein Z947_436 [Sulfitobacter geojensis]|nr:hypothetical protein Z947_436 [Sulfitobacter geojensis]
MIRLISGWIHLRLRPCKRWSFEPSPLNVERVARVGRFCDFSEGEVCA